MEGGELSLTRVVKLCEALEIGKTSQDLISSNNGSINRVSEYQQVKAGKRANNRNQTPGGPKGGAGTGCSNCGSKEHGSKLAERREKCKAFMETCSKCGTLGHYKNFCKGGTREQRAKSKDKGKVTAVSADALTPAATTTDAGDQSGSVGALAGGPTGSWMKISGSVESGHL